MINRTGRTLGVCLVLSMLLTSCSQDARESAPTEKSTHEKELEARITTLCQGGSDIDKAEERGISILCWAVEQNYVDAVKILLKNGADPDIRPMKGATETALYSTIKSLSYGNDALESQNKAKSKAIAELLIQHGANVSHTPRMKDTPLHKAALRGRTDLCELFTRNGAEVNAADALGNTPLHHAAKEGYWEATRFLLNNGARPQAANEFGETAISLARKRTEEPMNRKIRKDTGMNYKPDSDYDRTIELLMEHGAR